MNIYLNSSRQSPFNPVYHVRVLFQARFLRVITVYNILNALCLFLTDFQRLRDDFDRLRLFHVLYNQQTVVVVPDFLE